MDIQGTSKSCRAVHHSVPPSGHIPGAEGGEDWPGGPLNKGHSRGRPGLLQTEMTIAWLMRQVWEA